MKRKIKSIWNSLKFWRILGISTFLLTSLFLFSVYRWNVKYSELSEYSNALEKHIQYYSTKSFSWDGHLIMLDPKNSNIPKIEKSKSSSSSSLASTSSTSTSSSISESTSSLYSDSSTETSTSSSSVGHKNILESDAKEFATYLKQQINQTLADFGVTETVHVEYTGTELLYVIIPQQYKYYGDKDIQYLADSILGLKNTYFRNWTEENGFSSSNKAPSLILETPDGANLAEEDKWTSTMKLSK